MTQRELKKRLEYLVSVCKSKGYHGTTEFVDGKSHADDLQIVDNYIKAIDKGLTLDSTQLSYIMRLANRTFKAVCKL